MEPQSEPKWDQMAQLPGLRSVLDPSDLAGVKNRVIDAVHRRALAMALGDLRGKRVLDLGCGVGRLTGWLVSVGASVVGIDASAQMLSRARLVAPQVVRGGLKALPFADGSFDAISSVYVLQYLVGQTENYRAAVEEIARVLKPGGTLAMIEIGSDVPVHCGAPVRRYEEGLVAARMMVRRCEPIRDSASPILERVVRHPLLAHVPMLAALVSREARRSDGLPARRYGDFLFSATKPG